MSREGKTEEDLAVKYFQDRGFTAFNRGDRGFPDLIVIKDRRVVFFVEVKSGKNYIPMEQRLYHQKLIEAGFPTKGVRVIDGVVKIEEEQTCYPGQIWPCPKPTTRESSEEV